MKTAETLVGTPDRKPQCPFVRWDVAQIAGVQVLKETCNECRASIEMNARGEPLGFSAEADAAACDQYTQAEDLVASGQEG